MIRACQSEFFCFDLNKLVNDLALFFTILEVLEYIKYHFFFFSKTGKLAMADGPSITEVRFFQYPP